MAFYQRSTSTSPDQDRTYNLSPDVRQEDLAVSDIDSLPGYISISLRCIARLNSSRPGCYYMDLARSLTGDRPALVEAYIRMSHSHLPLLELADIKDFFGDCVRHISCLKADFRSCRKRWEEGCSRSSGDS